MSVWTITALALSRILATKTRSLLTMLGVIIGVASLVALTSVASGATSGINDSLGALGASRVTVTASTPTALTDEDAAAIAGIPGVEAVATQSTTSATLVYADTDQRMQVIGVSPSYAGLADPEVAIGTFLPDATLGAQRAVVLTAQGATDLGVTEDSVGSRVDIAGLPFTLVGVLDDADSLTGSASAYISLDAARRIYAPTPYVSTVLVNASSEEAVESVQAGVEALLRSRYHLGVDDDAQFTLTNQSSIRSTIDTVRSTLSLLLGGIASISLVVGGIGIMNIMLVSVRERTREIGIRRAIGARRGHILTQFVIEAVVLSTVGGLVGLVVGLGLSWLIALAGGWAFTISATTVLTALAFSLVVGVVFGAWPARTASRLQPVDALRFE